MSLDSVVGRISQIVAMQQQIADPAASIPAPAGQAGASTATAAGSAGGQSFGSALASALGTTGQSGPTLGALPTSSAPGAALGSTAATATASPLLGSLTAPAGRSRGTGAAQVQAMAAEANALIGKPYVYGGGHGSWAPQAGYDCSGFVSAVLHAGGYLSAPVDTTSLPGQPGILPGPGQYVTIYDRALPGQSGHVIISIDGQFYESGGSRGAWGGGGGVQAIAQPTADYLAQFPNVLHPSGL